MDMQAVSSSNVAAVGYDADSRKLRVEFHNGSTYEYSDVSQETFDELVAADSVGSYFNREVKQNYQYIKL
jgi:hypothetical protein